MTQRTGFSHSGALFLVWDEDARHGSRWAAELAAAEPLLAQRRRAESTPRRALRKARAGGETQRTAQHR